MSLAFFVAGLIQPALALAQRPRSLSIAEWSASAIFLVVSAALFIAGQLVIRRMED